MRYLLLVLLLLLLPTCSAQPQTYELDLSGKQTHTLYESNGREQLELTISFNITKIYGDVAIVREDNRQVVAEGTISRVGVYSYRLNEPFLRLYLAVDDNSSIEGSYVMEVKEIPQNYIVFWIAGGVILMIAFFYYRTRDPKALPDY